MSKQTARNEIDDQKTFQQMQAAAEEHAAGTPIDESVVPTILLPDSAMDCVEIIPRSYILDGIIESASIVMIAGKEKIGKSYVLMNLACCMASERPWLGRKTMQDEHGGVLWVNLDMKREAARRRVNEIMNGIEEAWNVRTPDLFKNFYMIHSQTFREQGLNSLTFDDNPDAKNTVLEMERLIKDSRYNIKVCFIDSQIQVEGTLDENVPRDAETLFRKMKEIRDATGCSFILIHHNTKYGDRGRGSSALFGETDLNLQLAPDINNSAKLILQTDGARDNAAQDIGMLKTWEQRLAEDGTGAVDDRGHPVWNFKLAPEDSSTINTSASAKNAKKDGIENNSYEKAVIKVLENTTNPLSKNEIAEKAHKDRGRIFKAVDRLCDSEPPIVVSVNGKFELSDD